MLTTIQKTQFLRGPSPVLSYELENPPRHLAFLDATRADLLAYPAEIDAYEAQYGPPTDPDEETDRQWCAQVLPWLLPLFASEQETVRELLTRLDPDVLAQHLGYAGATARLESMIDQLFEMGQELGMDADFWPVPGVPAIVLVIHNDDGPYGYVVPTQPLWTLLRDLVDRQENDDAGPETSWEQEETLWKDIVALAQTVTITVHP